MSATEELSSLYEIQVDAVSHNAEIAFDKVVGTSATVTLTHEGEVQRHFTGIVSAFAQGGTYDSTLGEMIVYRLTIVPWLWLLTLDSDCRVFEDLNVKDVISDVFERRAGGESFSLDLTATYSERPYCVQYRERDFDFVSRLFEQEGIGYCFEHGDGTHKLVAFDDSSALPDCDKEPELVYAAALETERSQNQINEWTVQQVVAPGRFALSGYDFASPSDDNLASASSTIKIGGNAEREIFDYPPYYTSVDGDRYAAVRMEELETASYRIRGVGACMPMVPGTHVQLAGHFREDLNGKGYLITRVEHSLTQSIGTDDTETSYSNVFHCIPDDITFRPPTRAVKPQVQGSQTALVVGPDGEEIHCDGYGRVRIQFPWDRHGPEDGTNVCWARTAQGLAGPKFGGIFTPRIGEEVVVNFIEGDPDRPLITGVVYNGNNQVPYPLPDNKTQSGIKTRSSKDAKAENYNEIRFEDKKGSEVFTIQAEKDLERLVKNDETDEVGNDRSRKVGNDETMTIGNDRALSVGRNHSIDVSGDHTESVSGKETLTVTKARDRSVGDAESVSIAKSQSITVSENRTIKVVGNHSLAVDKDSSESVKGKLDIDVTKSMFVHAKKIIFEADDEFSIKVGSAQIVMKKNGNITIKGGKITVKGSSDVSIKGSKIGEN